MFHEKFGFMLIFWNMAGVYVLSSSSSWSHGIDHTLTASFILDRPFTYCYPILYMARNDPATYRFPTLVYVALFVTLCCAYYV